jgi:osmotically-inducible protein OsmY
MTVKSSLTFAVVCAALGMLPVSAANAQQTTRDTTTGKPGTTTGKTATTATTKAEKLKYKSDEEITTQVRKALQNEKSLSTAARNVQISTKARYVTLKGKVPTPEEKSLIEARAADVAGDDYVVSELSVANKAATRSTTKK